MSDLRRDPVAESHARSDRVTDPAGDIDESVVTEARMTAQVSTGMNWPMVTLGAVAAAAFLGIAVIGLDRDGRGPSAEASGTVSPTATDFQLVLQTRGTDSEPSSAPAFATPQPTPSSSAGPVGGPAHFQLIEGPSACANDEFTVYVPHGWYTHRNASDTPDCQTFATDMFTEAGLQDVDGPRVTFEVIAADDTYIRERFGDTGDLREVTFSGLRAVRWELGAPGATQEDERGALEYVVFLEADRLPGDGAPQRVLHASYSVGRDDEDRHRAAFMGILGSLEMHDASTESARRNAAHRLFASSEGRSLTTHTCERADIGLTMELPQAWYTDTDSGPAPACMYLAARDETLTEQLPAHEAAQILVQVVPGDELALHIPGDVVTRHDREINGRPVLSVETVSVPGGAALWPGVRTYAYVIALDGDPPTETNTQRHLVISTSTLRAVDYPLARAVMDELVELVTLTDPD